MSQLGIAGNPITDMVYAIMQYEDIVSIIDGSNDTLLANITVGFQTHGIAINPVTDLIYVTNTASNSVSVIDGKTNRTIDTIMIGNRNVADDFEFTSHVAGNPKTNKVYVSNTLFLLHQSKSKYHRSCHYMHFLSQFS